MGMRHMVVFNGGSMRYHLDIGVTSFAKQLQHYTVERDTHAPTIWMLLVCECHPPFSKMLHCQLYK
ncbi:hypothetical protein C5167_020808 [Papaver somniferum]|uniref:Uncharacterized protein n=1 Tax=Papaver somniferum TaxID=3469 RepID=A0A4Y7IXA6_PAPSO|nr:hypothetical protein C5167_020808 [Papaver somniferum]